MFYYFNYKICKLNYMYKSRKTVVHKWQDGVLHAVIKVDVVYVNIVCVWKHLEEALDLATDNSFGLLPVLRYLQ